MQEQIHNKNLFLAKKLLEMIANRTVNVRPDAQMWVGEDNIPELSPDEIRDCLKALRGTGVIELGTEDHLDDNSTPLGADVITDQAKIREFCKIAEDLLSGIDMKKGEQARIILETLYALEKSKLDKDNQVKLSVLGFTRFPTFEWIADCTGIIEVIYKLEPEVDYNNRRMWVYGTSEVPRAVKVLDKSGLGRLYQQTRNRVGLSYQRRIDTLLRTKKTVEWRCVKCGHLIDRMTTQEEIVNYLIDFTIFRFKACHKCRGRNYFSINPRGKIDFLIGSKKTSREKGEDFYEML